MVSSNMAALATIARPRVFAARLPPQAGRPSLPLRPRLPPRRRVVSTRAGMEWQSVLGLTTKYVFLFTFIASSLNYLAYRRMREKDEEGQ